MILYDLVSEILLILRSETWLKPNYLHKKRYMVLYWLKRFLTYSYCVYNTFMLILFFPHSSIYFKGVCFVGPAPNAANCQCGQDNRNMAIFVYASIIGFTPIWCFTIVLNCVKYGQWDFGFYGPSFYTFISYYFAFFVKKNKNRLFSVFRNFRGGGSQDGHRNQFYVLLYDIKLKEAE